jgi:superfamily II DNA or RNA helicase
MQYNEFLKTKIKTIPDTGFALELSALNKLLFEWQKIIVKWAILKGRCALFLDTGLGKTFCQLEWAWQVYQKIKENILIFAPLAVSYQTQREGKKYGIEVHISRGMDDIKPCINIANYEIMDKFDLSSFGGIVLDESSIIKHFGTKTSSELIKKCKNVKYKLCCTATPAPNDYMELGMHSEFLGVMKRSEMLATFFINDASDTGKWRLKGHAKEKFWEWIASWACVVKTPGDLGFSDEGYILPELKIIQHIVKPDSAKITKDGKEALFEFEYAKTLNERRQAKKDSLQERIQTAAKIANSSKEQVLLWCDLNSESAALNKVIDDAIEVKGSDTTEHKTKTIIDFVNEKIKAIISKSSIYGFGINLQICHRIIFVSMNDSFERYYQTIRRCYRFGQKKPVEVHIITSEREGAIKENIERKQRDAEKMTAEMVKYTKKILIKELYKNEIADNRYTALEEMQIPDWCYCLEGCV